DTGPERPCRRCRVATDDAARAGRAASRPSGARSGAGGLVGPTGFSGGRGARGAGRETSGARERWTRDVAASLAGQLSPFLLESDSMPMTMRRTPRHALMRGELV